LTKRKFLFISNAYISLDCTFSLSLAQSDVNTFLNLGGFYASQLFKRCFILLILISLSSIIILYSHASEQGNLKKSVQTAKGNWNFNAGGPEKGEVGKPLWEEGSGFKSVKGITGQDDAIAISSGSNYIIKTPAEPSGGKGVNRYTIMFDVMVPKESFGQWISLLQTNQKNNNDADLLFSKTGKIGCKEGLGGYSEKTIVPGKWYRVILRVDNGVERSVFVNGEKWLAGSPGFIDDRYSLDKTFRIAADENGEDGLVIFSKITFWDTPLTDQEIIDLNTAGKKPEKKPEVTKRKPKTPIKPKPTAPTKPIKPKTPGKRTGILSLGGGGMPYEMERCNRESTKDCAIGSKTPYSGQAASYWSPTQIKNLNTYEDGYNTGPYKEFYKDGKIARQSQLVKGVRRGWFKYWHPDGSGDCTKFFDQDNSVKTYPFDHDPDKAEAAEKSKSGKIYGVPNLSGNLVARWERSPWEKYKNLEVTAHDDNAGWYIFGKLTIADLPKAVGLDINKCTQKDMAGVRFVKCKGNGIYFSFYATERTYKGKRLAFPNQLQLIKDKKIVKPCSATGDHATCLKQYFYHK